MKIAGKTFIVTGGASGLGQATTKHLISLGANVVIFDISIHEEDPSNDHHTLFVHVDVTNEQQVQDGIAQAVEKFGETIYGCINCAGVGDPTLVYDPNSGHAHPLQAFERILSINVTGTFNVLRLVVQQMMKQKDAATDGSDQERGVIINTASIAAYEGQIGLAGYSASKGAIVSMTLPIARELSHYNIRCVTIAPGMFQTPMLMDRLSEEHREALVKQVPYPKRLGMPEEYAKLAQFIIENPLMNGETIRLDGSFRMNY